MSFSQMMMHIQRSYTAYSRHIVVGLGFKSMFVESVLNSVVFFLHTFTLWVVFLIFSKNFDSF